MDLNEIQTILEAHTHDGTLRLPPDALLSAPISEIFREYLLDDDLVIRQVSINAVDNQNITAAGQGESFPFVNTYVRAVFTVPGAVAAMAIEANGFYQQTNAWNFGVAFPVLADTFYKDFQFTGAVFTLCSSNAEVTHPIGLFFSGSLQLTGALAVLGNLLNGASAVQLTGPIRIDGEKTRLKAVPVMLLADTEPADDFGLVLVFQLVVESTVIVDDEENPIEVVPVPLMRFVSRITVEAESGTEVIEISAHFSPAIGLLIFQADMDRLLLVSLSALNSLAQGANLGSVLPARLPLVNRFTLNQWSMSVIPDIPKITSISIGAGIAQPWTVIPGLFTLEAINFAFTVIYREGRHESSAALTGAIKFLEGDEQFTVFVAAQYPSYTIIGSLEEPEPEEDDEIDFEDTDEVYLENNEIDLIALVRWILNDTIADSLPCSELKVTALTLLINPNNSTFTLETFITTNCSFDLGMATFTLTEIHFNFSYVAGNATGSFAAAFWILLPEPGVDVAELFSDDPPEGAVPMAVSAAYNGAEDGWSFRGGLTNEGQIDLPAIIERYLPKSYQDFVPDVVITQLEAGFETGESQSYDFTIGAEWNISLLNTTISGLVKIASRLEGDRRVDEGQIQGTLRFGGHGDEGGLELVVTAEFNDEDQIYTFEFLGWKAELKSSAAIKTLRFSASRMSLGEMIEVLINAVFPGQDISLVAPWNVLNSVSLGDFDFVVKFSDGPNATPETASLRYTHSINIGFARIDEIVLEYGVTTEEVTFKIPRGQFLGKEITPNDPLQWNVAEPETTPPVPGQGTELFRLDFLGVGQHMGVMDNSTRTLAPVPASVLGAIAQLTEAFEPENNLSLVFNEASDWLIGTRFIVIEAVDVGVVFYDPELFGLVISVTGNKAKQKLPIFEGLVFEILYKKINDTIGMWQINLTLPTYIRRLEFGAVSVTLPSLKLQIYTNGDFLVDLGFPTNGDFSRSFSLQAFPFVGSGGVYFGKLSSATSDAVPQTSNGSFSPIITFGLGLRIGLGKDLKYGPLKAGMSVTVQGVLEGVFAWYNPYPTSVAAGSPGERQMIPAGSRKIVPRRSRRLAISPGGDDVYYMIQARVALVGKIYGKVDLKIIEATVDVEIKVSIRMVLEAYRAIDIYFQAHISLTLRVRINLGLFKVTIKLSYSLRLSFSFTIGSNSVPPWGQSALLRQSSFMRQLDASDDEECPPIPANMKWQPILVVKGVSVPLLFVPQFTAGTDGPLGVGSPRKSYVVAMTYVDSTHTPGALSPFDDIAKGTLLWTLNAYLNSDKDHTTLDELLSETISIDQLNDIYCYLTQKEVVEPFTETEVIEFLRHYFEFHVTIPNETDADQDVSIFPILPMLSLTTSTGVNVDFSTQTPASEEYLASIKAYFEEMAVRYKSPSEKANENPQTQSTEDSEKSLASFIFLDFFAMLARSTIQDAINSLQEKEAPLDPDESLANFVQRRSELAIDVASLALANPTRSLRPGIQLRVPGVVYTIKRGDTLQSIAAKFNHDILELRQANPLIEGRLTPAAELRLPPIIFTTSSEKSESLLDISRIYGVSIAELARANQDVAELFPAGEPLLVPFAQQEKVGQLVLDLTDSFNELSGLAARVLLQGLRPPAPADSPQAGATAPLYKLTGQQIDASTLAAGDTITLTAPETDKGWFRLGLGLNNSLTYRLTARSAEKLDSLQTAQFGPAVKFEPVNLLRIEPRRFTLATSTLWHTPNTSATINLHSQPSASPVEPRVWQFPSELIEVITEPQAMQPKVELWKQRQEGPGQEYPREPVVHYMWSSKIEIQVRRTASGDNVFLPCTYEVTGIDAGASQLLENLLVWYSGKNVPNIYQLQILYPPNPVVPGKDRPPVGLKSDSDPTFFLLQTNLSTASQPPRVNAAMASRLGAASPQQDPLGQLDIEFLKLLWESSVVNSGGYVLYYQAGPKSSEGLPGYLFSQDGIATLTLLITYSFEGNVLQNYLNSVVIDEAIDIENEVLYASPVPQTVSNFNLSPDESLADVAARFRVTVSQLATQYDNAHATLSTGKHLRIPPLTYRVRAGDLLETIAARAGVTAQSIIAANSGVNTADLTTVRFLRIPETTWRVEAGDSLASLADRFSTTVMTLAHANKNLPGVVEGSLQFDDRLEEMIPTIPPGNVAFSLRRPYVGVSRPEDDPQQQLDELYNVLAYRIKQGNGFEASNSALPISLVTPEETKDWFFESVVPVFPFATPTEDVTESVPDPRQDPYNGVGSTVELNFNWQDLFGNWLDSDVQHQSWPDQAFDVGYIDEIIALDEWPAVTSDYTIAPNQQGNPELTVTLRFNTDLYLPADDPEAAKEMALTDLGKFELIYYQLTQPDVSVTVSSTMQPGVQVPLAPVQVMVQFVLDIINFLEGVIELRPEPPERLEAAISQPTADENPLNLFALTVSVKISRELDLVHDEFKDIPAVYVVSSQVPANAGNHNETALSAEPVAPLSLQEFAQQLETAFPSLKVLVAAPKKGLSQTDEEIWIARFAETSTGIAFRIDGQRPLFFADPPLARNLLSRPDVLVYPYQSGKFIGAQVPIKTSQNSVDLDQMGRDFLTAMEEVLGPQFAASIWKLQFDWAYKPPPDIGEPKYPYETIIAAKKLLADSISAGVINVFETSDPNEGLAEARETFRQQLLVNLTAAFTVDVIMQYPVEITHSQYAGTDPFAPQLFGKPVTENPDDPQAVERKDAYSFSTGKFSLAKRARGTHLTFSFDTNREQQGRDGSQFDDVFTIDLFHQINALEHEIHPVEGIEGYLASSWLTFVLPDSFEMPGERKLLVPLGTQTIPVPLRAYPTPPSLSEQTFIPHAKQFAGDSNLVVTTDDELVRARLWNYHCQYEYVGAAHDKILADVKLNVPAEGIVQAQFDDRDNPDLFASLVQFTAAYPGIAKDLDQYLAKGIEPVKAWTAITSFAWLAQRTANAWRNWEAQRELHTVAAPQSPEYHFVITQHSAIKDDVNALVVMVAVDGVPRLPSLPMVEIAGYKTEPLTPPTPDSAAYFFVSLENHKILTYEDGRALSSRSLVFRDFDVLKVENAWAGAAVKRNEDLLPDTVTNPDFILQSPVVRFINVLTPLLDPDVEINIADYTTKHPAPLARFLSNFLTEFFAGAQTVVNEMRTIRIGAAYGYGLDAAGGNAATEQTPDLNITIPILLTLPTSISILNLSPDSPFIRSVSDTITAWFTHNGPSGVENSGRLWFDLSIYSSLSEGQLPVLRMRRLYLETRLLLYP